jgi:3-hydroxyisobutyrate dehydrogenase-like beta-hydroxyacid dehydrogenase
MLQVLAHTAVVAPAHQGKLLRAEHDDFSPQFPLSLMGKDFKLILDQANALHLPMPATTASYAVNRKCAERGEEVTSRRSWTRCGIVLTMERLSNKLRSKDLGLVMNTKLQIIFYSV